MKYSVIVPVFNRPDEVDELLESLTGQTFKDFEVIIVEDGSERDCRAVAERYSAALDVKYYVKKNSGPGQSRNYGAERASGEYLIVLDSDVVLPPGYMQAVDDELAAEPADAFGAPLVHRHPEGYILLDDEFFHHGRHTWRKEEARQVLSALVQHGDTP